MSAHHRVMLDRLPEGGRLLYCGPRDPARPLDTGAPAGASVTILSIDDLEAIPTREGARFDVIVVDGSTLPIRLLERIRPMLAPDGVVFLEHAQHPGLDGWKQDYREHASVGPEPGSDSHLWCGGLGAPRGRAGDPPVIVSYFTTDTPYVALADRLRAACDGLGLTHHIVPREPRGSWEANCAAKADVCLTAWRTLRQPILWVDADAIVRARPVLLSGTPADFAVHKAWGWQFASGTIFFGQTPLAERLLETWGDRCAREPRVFDQVHLDHAWNEIVAGTPLHTVWLPRAYCQILDAPLEHGEAPVIEHFQASRSCKAAVTVGDPMPRPVVRDDVKQARRASRPSPTAA